MGRWPYSNRWTVEECNSISTKSLNEHNYFDGSVRSGGLSWSRRGEETGSVSFIVSVEDEEYMQFQYTETNRHTGEITTLDYKVQLTWTPCNFGGRRWWFVCPLNVNGNMCGRRVGVLYLGGKYFGCRHCYNLTYKSSKENHKFDRLFLKIGIDPQKGKKLFKGGLFDGERRALQRNNRP